MHWFSLCRLFSVTHVNIPFLSWKAIMPIWSSNQTHEWMNIEWMNEWMREKTNRLMWGTLQKCALDTITSCVLMRLLIFHMCQKNFLPKWRIYCLYLPHIKWISKKYSFVLNWVIIDLDSQPIVCDHLLFSVHIVPPTHIKNEKFSFWSNGKVIGTVRLASRMQLKVKCTKYTEPDYYIQVFA